MPCQDANPHPKRRLIPDIMPVFSFAAPFFRQWNSVRTMRNLDPRVRLLMLSGAKDEIIPPRHMRELWEAACSGQTPASGAAQSTNITSSSTRTEENGSELDSNKSGKVERERFRWTKLHVDLLARLRLRTHRREESVQSAMVPTEAPSELEAPRTHPSRSSTEKVKPTSTQTVSAEGIGRRKGRFVSIKDGTHSEFLHSFHIMQLTNLSIQMTLGTIQRTGTPSSSSWTRSPPQLHLLLVLALPTLRRHLPRWHRGASLRQQH